MFFNDVIFHSTDLSTACHVHTELVSDIGYKVQAVLVEEDEEEDAEEHEENMAETQPRPFAFATEPVQTEAEGQEQDEEEEKKEEQEEDKEEEEEGFKQEAESAEAEMPVEVIQEEERAKDDGEESNQSEHSQVPAEPVESAVTGSLLVLLSCCFDWVNIWKGVFLDDLKWQHVPQEQKITTLVIVLGAEPICQEIKHETVVLSTNGMTNGENTQEQNGIGLTTS